jgi:hypothetical protein
MLIGVAKTWGLTPSFLGVRHERIVAETAASLLIVHSHRTRDDAPARKRVVPAGTSG